MLLRSGGWLVENLQSTHRDPHVSRERLVHCRVVQRQENRHVWLQEGEERARVILKKKKKCKKHNLVVVFLSVLMFGVVLARNNNNIIKNSQRTYVSYA